MDSKFKIIHNSLNPQNYSNNNLNSKPIHPYNQHRKALKEDLDIILASKANKATSLYSDSPTIRKKEKILIPGWPFKAKIVEGKLCTKPSIKIYNGSPDSLIHKSSALTSGTEPVAGFYSDTSMPLQSTNQCSVFGASTFYLEKPPIPPKPKCRPKVPPKPKSRPLLLISAKPQVIPKVKPPVPPKPKVKLHNHYSHFRDIHNIPSHNKVKEEHTNKAPTQDKLLESRENNSRHNSISIHGNLDYKIHYTDIQGSGKYDQDPQNQAQQYDIYNEEHIYEVPLYEQVLKNRENDSIHNSININSDLQYQNYETDNQEDDNYYEELQIHGHQYDGKIDENIYEAPNCDQFPEIRENQVKLKPDKIHGNSYHQVDKAGTGEKDDYTTKSKCGTKSSIDKDDSSISDTDHLPSCGPQINLWQHLPQVIHSGLLTHLSPREVSLHESMYEVMTSEASYLKSLKVLCKHFVYNFELQNTMTYKQSQQLFSSISAVKECSELFLSGLEIRCQESIRMSSISDIIIDHIGSSLEVYISYCTNTVYQEKILQQLLRGNSRFCDVVRLLEASPECQGLRLLAFLILPMQRVTRLLLLVKAILKYTDEGTEHWQETSTAMNTLEELVNECNEGTRRTENLETVLDVYQSLNFQMVDRTPAMSASNCFLRHASLTILSWDRQDGGASFFWSMVNKKKVELFLFTDLFIICEEKKEGEYLVLDHCPRNMTEIEELSQNEIFPSHIFNVKKFLFRVTMLQNHQDKTNELIMSITSETEKEYWLNAFISVWDEDFQSIIYEDWNPRIVEAVYDFNESIPEFLSTEALDANRSEFLPIAVADVIKLKKKLADGWSYGERLSDGTCGWFPEDCIKEMPSDNLRARNLWKRHNLLKCTHSIINQIKY